MGLSEAVAAAAASGRDGERRTGTGKEVLLHRVQPVVVVPHLRERAQAASTRTITPRVGSTARVLVLNPQCRISSSATMHRLFRAKYRSHSALSLPATRRADIRPMRLLYAAVEEGGGAGAVAVVDLVGGDGMLLST